MARLALKVKAQKLKNAYFNDLGNNKKPKFPTRVHNRCKLCGRNGGYLRKFEMCRICFRENARQGKIAGVRKSSW